MPVNVVKSQRDERLWEEAKQQAAKQLGKRMPSPELAGRVTPDKRYWRLVMGIYQRMKGRRRPALRKGGLAVRLRKSFDETKHPRWSHWGMFSRDSHRDAWMEMVINGRWNERGLTKSYRLRGRSGRESRDGGSLGTLQGCPIATGCRGEWRSRPRSGLRVHLHKGGFADPFVTNRPVRNMTPAELARAIRLDIVAEQEAIALYEAHADAVGDVGPDAARVLRSIAEEEKVHVGELERLLAVIGEGQDEVCRKKGADEVDERLELGRHLKVRVRKAASPENPTDRPLDDAITATERAAKQSDDPFAWELSLRGLVAQRDAAVRKGAFDKRVPLAGKRSRLRVKLAKGLRALLRKGIRRGHYRQLPSGQRVWVRQAWDPRTGKEAEVHAGGEQTNAQGEQAAVPDDAVARPREAFMDALLEVCDQVNGDPRRARFVLPDGRVLGTSRGRMLEDGSLSGAEHNTLAWEALQRAGLIPKDDENRRVLRRGSPRPGALAGLTRVWVAAAGRNKPGLSLKVNFLPGSQWTPAAIGAIAELARKAQVASWSIVGNRPDGEVFDEADETSVDPVRTLGPALRRAKAAMEGTAPAAGSKVAAFRKSLPPRLLVCLRRSAASSRSVA